MTNQVSRRRFLAVGATGALAAAGAGGVAAAAVPGSSGEEESFHAGDYAVATISNVSIKSLTLEVAAVSDGSRTPPEVGHSFDTALPSGHLRTFGPLEGDRVIVELSNGEPAAVDFLFQGIEGRVERSRNDEIVIEGVAIEVNDQSRIRHVDDAPAGEEPEIMPFRDGSVAVGDVLEVLAIVNTRLGTHRLVTAFQAKPHRHAG